MAHLVESMAYVGATPWHGLGKQLTLNQPLDVWARQAGMDWSINEAPVCFAPGKRKATIPFPDNKVLFRSDTQAPLSVVSQRFQVVQPREILEFYRDLTEVSGFELEAAGVLKGGRKLWALAKTGESFALKGNDVSHAYVLLATGCDGTLATTALLTSVRVVCNNTLAVALKGGTGAVKVPHSTRFDPQQVKEQLGISVSTWDDFMYRMKALSERKMKHAEVERYFASVFPEFSGKSTSANRETPANKALVLYEGNGKGAQLASSKGTAFGLLNAVTQFVDHERRARNPDYRLDSAWFGQGATIKQKALEQALLLVS